MISAIMSNGDFIWLIINDTGNTKKFWDFLCILYYAINYDNMRNISECVIMLDNASIHCSKGSLKTVEAIGINWLFLPAYSPMLAPVELFFRAVKNKMRMNLSNNKICLNNPKDRIYIYDTIRYIDWEWIRSLWKQFVKNAKNAILRFY